MTPKPLEYEKPKPTPWSRDRVVKLTVRILVGYSIAAAAGVFIGWFARNHNWP